MKHLRFIFKLIILLLLVSVLVFGKLALPAWAEVSEGDFTYEIKPEAQTVVITAYHGGPVAVVPNKLGGLPVSDISYDALYQLTRGKSLTIPQTVERFATVNYLGLNYEGLRDRDFSSFMFYVFPGSTAESLAFSLGSPYEYFEIKSDGSYNYTHAPVAQVLKDDSSGNTELNLPSGYNGDGFYGSLAPCKECGFEHVTAIYSGDGGQVTLPSHAYRYKIRHYYDQPRQNGDTYYTQEKLGFPGSTEVLDSLYQSYPALAIDRCQAPDAVKVFLPDCITHIGEECFVTCQKLTSLRIPPLVQAIKYRTFAYCTSLGYMDLNGVKSIEEEAFFDCRSLSNLALPGTLTKIGKGAFVGCDNLKSVTIPASVTEIGAYAFGYDTCDSGIPGSEEHVVTNRKSAYTDFTIYGYAGSAAEEYCKKNDFIRFIPINREEKQNDWTAVIDEIADRYASGETLVTVKLTETTKVPKEVFTQIKGKEKLTVDFVLSPEISWTIKAKDIGTPREIDFKTIFTQAPEAIGKGVRIQGAEKVFYLKLPERNFAYSESMNIDLGDKYDDTYSLDFFRLAADGKSLEPVEDLICTSINGSKRKTYLRSLLPNSEYYLILHQNGFSTSFSEMTESELLSSGGSFSQTGTGSKTVPIVITALVAGAGLSVALIKKKKN